MSLAMRIFGLTPSDERQTMALSAATIYAGAALVGVIETLIPGGPEFSVLPGLACVVLTPLTLVFGPRLPRSVLALQGPLGAALIAYALSTTRGHADAAVLYMWPVLWMAYFYRRAGTVFIVLWVGLVHGLALMALPAGVGNADRWIDVVVSVLVVGGVVQFLSARNERLVADLVSEARVDALTGLLNRRGFNERIDIEVARARRDGYLLAVVELDLDHFKRVNDAHGHEVGDRVLRWLGAVLTRQLRAGDVAARLGGEEFALVLPRADEHAARMVAERVRESVQAPGSSSGRAEHGVSETLPLTISAGVAVSAGGMHGQDLLEAADSAMYAAKRRGRNQTVVAGGLTTVTGDRVEPSATAVGPRAR